MIKIATRADAGSLASLAKRLWPESNIEELRNEFIAFTAPRDLNNRCFLALAGALPDGFAQVSVRYDFVEGCDHTPVCYLEGIFVREAYRGQGLGKALVKGAEDFGLTRGCREFAADCALDNAVGAQFHAAMGLTEVGRIICFKKDISTAGTVSAGAIIDDRTICEIPDRSTKE